MNSIMQMAFPFVIIAFVLYRRVKRSIGFQRFSSKRLKFRIVIFSIIGVILLAVSIIHPILILADVVGITAGAVLSYYAIRHFIYEWRDELLYTRTHIYIESTVLILFLGRVLYRVLAVFMISKNLVVVQGDNQMAQYTRDPYTVGIFCVILTYYIIYNYFLIRKGKALSLEKTQAIDLIPASSQL
ncbi:hypothetical protein EHS13_11865 [Paenibacillus psychroresistens]|uniref:DUF1453 family protein n=1 Tax=Paenibacillus psychroresistens TaxID=1778678 RepID=A0A6B8RIT9_9BACL|nr:hypothetical protein [Paenibacillus psychroresistens]QGQ95525.1 hypothetical protein EHS13_11865 [Paenibacillus psychroresistens]